MKHVSKIKNLLFVVVIVAMALTVGCASVPFRTETSKSGIRAAEEVGAADLPQAALHLQLAKEQLAKAEGLAKNGENEEAASMLLRANADAELAVTLSHGEAERLEAEKAMARVSQLRQENL
ncbi:MAG: DUF4398 domain-containing protein [Proteobacteria bacterium]|nr:DUF4398 domain-containing protein [Pseudomonadota bacterium]